jgi:thiamine kinase-like enzyme
LLAGYERIVDLLGRLPVTLIHGEFYPANVLVADGKIVPIDWEMAGVGPGLLDLAALTTGWSREDQAAITSAYGDVPEAGLDASRLHLALRWLSTPADWIPPPEQAHDWLGEAIGAAERLRL